MSDGSGLSRYNYLTASTVMTVLQRMYQDPRHREAFLATLAIAGRDGTLASRLAKTRAKDNALAKTGFDRCSTASNHPTVSVARSACSTSSMWAWSP